MSKITFYYGTMAAGKTLRALVKAYDFRAKGFNVLLLKPNLDTRTSKMWSRIGIEADCEPVEEFLNKPIKNVEKQALKIIIIDESQFLTAKQIDALVKLSEKLNIDIYFYGLLTDFTGHLFTGTKRILEVTDQISEISSLCWCGKKAIYNGLILDGKVIKKSNTNIMIGDSEYYSVCRKHFNEGKYKKE